MSAPSKSIDTGALPADHVGSLARGLRVMSVLAASPSGITLSEVASATGLTRAGARRLLLTLVAEGYARQDERLFALTPRLLGMARLWLTQAPLWSRAEPHMRHLSSALNESCSAAVLSGADVVYVARVASRHILNIALDVGTRLPAYCTSMGRVLLAGLPQAELAAALAATPLARRTDATVTDIAALTGIIGNVRSDGFAIVDGELEPGLRSIAVPIHDRHGIVVAALNVSTQASRRSLEEMRQDFLPRLLSARREIEAYLQLG